jgi:hypothetical protein
MPSSSLVVVSKTGVSAVRVQDIADCACLADLMTVKRAELSDARKVVFPAGMVTLFRMLVNSAEAGACAASGRAIAAIAAGAVIAAVAMTSTATAPDVL